MWDNPGNVRETVCGKRSKEPRRIQAFRTVSSRFGSCSRGVAQPGSAPALGAGGPGFESRRPDQQPDRNKRKSPSFPRNGCGSQGQLPPEAQSITSPLLPRISRVSRNESAQKPAHRMEPLGFLPVILRSSKNCAAVDAAGCAGEVVRHRPRARGSIVQRQPFLPSSRGRRKRPQQFPSFSL